MLKVSRRIMVSAPRDSVRCYLQDVKNLPRYEGCTACLESVKPRPSGADFSASGRCAGLPWRARFRMDFSHDGGYRLSMTQGPLREMTAQVTLRPVTGGTVVTYEHAYHLPLPLRIFKPFLEPSLRGQLERQLRVVKEGAESLHRRLQLQAIEGV